MTHLTIPPHVDDDAVARDDASSEHIGTIQAELLRGIKLGAFLPKPHDLNGTGPSTGPIHERSKKAGSHRVGWVYSFMKRASLIQLRRFGEEIYRPPGSVVKVEYIDSTPWLTFRFLYRKRGVLFVPIGAVVPN